MLAQAKPLWLALPDGSLKRQILAELARQGQLELPELSTLWGGTAATAPRPPASPRNPAVRAPLGSPGRRAPAAQADLALRLLLRHSDWWARLSNEDHTLLHELGGEHGEVVAWLESQLMEHGDQTWAALEQALQDLPWHARARQWVDAADAEEEQSFDDLARVVARMWIDHLGAESRELAAAARTPEDLQRLRHLNERIAVLKAGLAPAGPAKPG
jgi:DNA primase